MLAQAQLLIQSPPPSWLETLKNSSGSLHPRPLLFDPNMSHVR